MTGYSAAYSKIMVNPGYFSRCLPARNDLLLLILTHRDEKRCCGNELFCLQGIGVRGIARIFQRVGSRRLLTRLSCRPPHQDIVMAFSPPEYCRLFAQKNAYQGGVTGTPGLSPLATLGGVRLKSLASKAQFHGISWSNNALLI